MTNQITVAYIEDEPSIAQLLASGLSLFGITVKPIYMSAEALLEDVDSEEFKAADMMMSDIRLPRMNGIELATELRSRGESRPLILVSAWPAPNQDKLDAIQAEFLPKPFDFATVVQKIKELTDSL